MSGAIPARLIHSRVLILTDIPYVEAARAFGSSDSRIIRRHIWPAVRAIVAASVASATRRPMRMIVRG